MSGIRHRKQISAFGAFWRGLLALELFFLAIMAILLLVGLVVAATWLGFNEDVWKYGFDGYPGAEPRGYAVIFAILWVFSFFGCAYALVVTPFLYPLVGIPVALLIDRNVSEGSWRRYPLFWAAIGGGIMLLPPMAAFNPNLELADIYGLGFLGVVGGAFAGFAISRKYFGLSFRSALRIARPRRDRHVA